MIARRPWRSGQSGETGFSLIEVVLAIGILAGVLLSICSMFIMGGRQLKGGKTMTEATAMAHDIMETFDKRRSARSTRPRPSPSPRAPGRT